MKPFSICLLFASALVLALGSCSTPPPVVRTDPELERNVALARGAYAAGAADKAAIYYQKALQRSRVMDSPQEIGRNAYNLAACLAAMRQLDTAQACLDEARLEFERAGTPCRELSLLEARIDRAQGHIREAESLARAELKKSKTPDDAILVQWHLLLTDLLCDQGRAADAEAELARIGPRQLEPCGADIRAETELAGARVQMLKRDPKAAAIHYDGAARHWQEAERYGDMAAALDRAGHAYEDAGDKPAAADRYYRAARSLWESGQMDQARDLAGRALPLAAASLSPALQRQIERLKADIDRQTQKAQHTAP